jgi:hypothetical protein
MATTTSSDLTAWPRWINLLIGAWVFISAFVWPHTAGAQTNTWILGALIVLASIWAMNAPRARYVNTVLAIWLFFATAAIGYAHPATGWSNMIAAVVVFILSLIPSSRAHFTPGGHVEAHA